MKLIDIYARATGLKIKTPFLQEKFYPLAEERYFTIQGSSGQAAKCYDYFPEILDIISPFLKANNITIIQLGAKEDQPIAGCKHLMGQTTIAQSYYILRRAILHIGNDSWLAHAAGILNKPLVALYGSTSSWVHGPYFFNKNATVLLDSHRNNNIPTYSQENNKTVNLIPPEAVANAILQCCGIPNKIPQETYYIGKNYRSVIAEYVPNFVLDPNIFPNQPVTVRMDYHFNEDALYRILSMGRVINLVTNKAINPALLAHFKSQILGVAYEVTASDTPAYIKQIRQIGLKINFFCKETNAEKLSTIRMNLFDVVPSIGGFQCLTRTNFCTAASNYSNKNIEIPVDAPNITYRSNKYLLSEGKIYLSKAAWKQNLPVPSFANNVQRIIDIPDFWEEFEHFRIFKILNNENPTPTADNK